MTDATGRVLLYSGGMDSVALSLLQPWDRKLYVDMGTRYSAAELARLAPDVQVVQLPLGQWERPDAIVPLRNLMLVCVAAQYGDVVGMAATAGDRVLDKSPEFARRTTELLSFLWSEQHWTPGKEVQVVLPTKKLTKRELVWLVARLGADALVTLAGSFSCYDPSDTGGECGICKPCVRKWVAFAAEGHGGLVVNAEPVARQVLLPAIRSGEWDRGDTEAADVLAALGEAA